MVRKWRDVELSNGSQTAKRENERPSWSHRRQYVRANVLIPFGGSLTWEVDVEVFFLCLFFETQRGKKVREKQKRKTKKEKERERNLMIEIQEWRR